jgi:nicotinate-nucleotide pyrophosphorylase (carboxylating)
MSSNPVRLDPAEYQDLVRHALQEDIGRGDVTTQAIVGADERARGLLIVKSPGVIAGLDIAAETFRQLDPRIILTMHRCDGESCASADTIAEIFGRAQALLIGERTALNFLQRLSGIATLTRRFVEAADHRLIILDTRKTTPTLRALEKYAVRVGGATNHRMRLDDGVLIKDNHIKLAGGIGPAVARARKAQLNHRIEVEVETLQEVDAALEAGADMLMLDNMSIPDIREAVRRCRGRAKTEISGGVSLERIPELSSTGADFMSSGALTHSAPAVDISFEIEPA